MMSQKKFHSSLMRKQIRRFYWIDRQMHAMKKKRKGRKRKLAHELATKRVIPCTYFLVKSVYNAHVTGEACSRLRKHTFTHLISVVGLEKQGKRERKSKIEWATCCFSARDGSIIYDTRISVLSLYVPDLFKFVVGISYTENFFP